MNTSLANALKLLSQTPRKLALIWSLDHDARPISRNLTTHPAGRRGFITIGPGGDLPPSESGTLRNHGFTAVSLGRKILRSELAALVALISITTGTSLDEVFGRTQKPKITDTTQGHQPLAVHEVY